MAKTGNGSKKRFNKKTDSESLLLTYEELLFKKEQFLKEGESFRILYVQEFGELTAEVFKAKIECIRLKKMITFCQKAVNMGKRIEVNLMNETIDKEMLVYEAELQSIVRENKAASNAVSVDKFELDMSKKIYRRLAKKLHPDVNKMTEKDERLQDLWEKIRIAYKNSDVDRLEELEVLVNAVFKELGEEAIEMDLSNLEEKISNLEDRIAQILTEKPYIYGKLLDDEDKVSAKKEEMEKELKEYKDYAAELEEILADLMMKGGASITWTSK